MDSSKIRSTLTTYTLLILLITWFGAAARFINLGGDSLWFDEMLTLNEARQNPAEVITTSTVRPPGMYLAEHFVLQIFGDSEYALRLLSALAGAVTIPLMYVIGSELANRRVGLLAALLLSVSPLHIRYSQEARYYAIQVAFATASMACVLIAINRRQWRWWIGFGLATALNAYVQFGSFLVLATQIMLVGLLALSKWLLKRWPFDRALNVAIGLGLGVAIAGVFYSPWIEPAIQGALANIGPDATRGGWSGVPIGDWLAASYFAFGYLNPIGAALMGVLCAIGLGTALVRHRLVQTIWLIVGLATPYLLIKFVDVARAPLPKYVLIVLPVYLIPITIAIDGLIDRATRWLEARRRFAARFVPAIMAIGLLGLTVPSVLAEHAHIEEDWKGIAQYLSRVAHEGDVFVPITLDLPDAFNQGYSGLDHYLPQFFSESQLLMGEHLTDPEVANLEAAAKSNGRVWFTVLKRNGALQFNDPNIEVIPFQSSIYLVHSVVSDRAPLQEMIALYPKFIPYATTPCYLWLDLARLYIQLDQYDQAAQTASRFSTPCPGSTGIRQALYHYLLDHDLVAGQTDRALDYARQILTLDAKDAAALNALTVYDLSALYQHSTSGAAPSPLSVGATAAQRTDRIVAEPSPVKPIEVQRFEMPQDGDWGEALVMQTPARLSYHLTLPRESTLLRARAAMFPESWDWGGDGATFIVRVNDQVMFDQYVSNQVQDRKWHDVRVPLDQFAGQTITLTLQTDPGPADDTTGDWAGWDSPRIVYSLEP